MGCGMVPRAEAARRHQRNTECHAVWAEFSGMRDVGGAANGCPTPCRRNEIGGGDDRSQDPENPPGWSAERQRKCP